MVGKARAPRGHFTPEGLEVQVRIVLTGVHESLLVWARCREGLGFQ